MVLRATVDHTHVVANPGPSKIKRSVIIVSEISIPPVRRIGKASLLRGADSKRGIAKALNCTLLFDVVFPR
jgi:hypothetical protein